ncbi:acyl-CoA synthetase [Gammaproteobacteria bacterium]|uniref:Long-chain fatty acid--CoA ligase n=1 Tax=OM182 bacterium MED-G28 TaxID=1986256 RepID=A0A2A5WEL9_9GAMM|nr:acyl-CoA synthetase [Gammaproteobacteria bacterium]PDH34929.1 MAG: long-chain fatty acid--CoA ligase [OM182 bacterium MED-G28]|tara:strand:- start:171 stop:1655 length:1485 start_codon:yes stop_codon:yes gene_type:complete
MAESPFPYLHNDSERVALVEADNTYTYSEVNSRVNRFATGLLGNKDDLQEERIAFFMPASLDYVTTMHGVWRAGGIAVPLNVASAVSELDHYLSCASVTRMVANAEYQESLRDLCASLNIELMSADEVLADAAGPLPKLTPERRAMMLFTSGTTNKPKGVVSTHKTIHAQITTLIDAWEWSENDVIPLFLPLHHIHGIINILSCGLWAGATVHLFAKFDIPKISHQIVAGTYNVFMAVPTIYVKLIQYFDSIDPAEVQKICDGFKDMRLNISGSAACPVKLFNQWKGLTGQVLLERYGMTEIGMGISNPYNGERRAGAVGQALPGVDCELFDENDSLITEEAVAGEIRIKGDNVFLEYWDNATATKESFKDSWFCTGDVAVLEDGYYRIMGRSSVDIIKSGGYKLSALEIEGVLLTHDDIEEVAVIGVEDDTWGEAVTAFVAVKAGASLEYEALKEWCDGRMSSYKIPKSLILIEALPRNAMGKVTKPVLKEML